MGGVGDEVPPYRFDALGLGDVADHEQDRSLAARGRRRGAEPAGRFAAFELNGHHPSFGPGSADRFAQAGGIELGDAVGPPAEMLLEGGVGEGGVPRSVEQQHSFLHGVQDQVLDLMLFPGSVLLSRKGLG